MGAVAVIGGATALLIAGYFVNQSWQQEQRAAQAQQRMLNAYERATNPIRQRTYSAPSQVELPADMLEAKARRERLMNHPAVTPREGFDMPGVQSTGIAIVDAIEQAQSSRR